MICKSGVTIVAIVTMTIVTNDNRDNDKIVNS